MEKLLLIPMTAYVFYIGALALLNLRVRVQAVKNGKMPGSYFKAYQGEIPERVTVVGRHYDNQFQVPLLFFIVGVAFLATKQTNIFTIALAWAFVATRLGHSFEHLGKNRPLTRAAWFAGGWTVVGAMWVQLCYLTWM